ncbi:MAG: CpaF family protein [Actinomycetes bacterium]
MSLAERLGQASIQAAGPTRARHDAMGEEYLSEYVELKQEVQDCLMDSVGQQLYSGRIDQIRLEGLVFEAIQTVLARDPRPLSGGDRARIVQEVIDSVLGNGPLEPLLRDPGVTEIMVNRYDVIFMEKGGKIYPTSMRFADESHLRQTIDRIVSRVGRRVDEASPMVDARLPDGSRVNAVIPPVALDGSSLTIRKFSAEPFTAGDLITMGTLSRQAIDFMRGCVKGRMNILISGGTGSGKTTTLNVLSSFIPDDERIITVEDAAELQLPQPHVIRLESRPANVEGQGLITVRDLVRNSLRMRPDRIIVGEVRDAAALDMLQAMNTGHDGSLSTVHANTPRDALSRVETMVLMAGMELPVRVIREQVSNAIQLVVQQARLRDGTRHVTQISEIVGMDNDTILMQDIYDFEFSRHPGNGPLGRLVATGITPHFTSRLLDNGVELPPELFGNGSKEG